MATPIGKRVYEALNKEITEHFMSAYFFLGAAGIFKDMGLPGCAKWAVASYKELRATAIEMFQFLMRRKVKARFLPIPAPKQDWRAPLHIFEEASRQMQRATGSIYTIYEFTMAEKDYSSQIAFMKWIEAKIAMETQTTNLLERLRKMQTTDIGVFTFDGELNRMYPGIIENDQIF